MITITSTAIFKEKMFKTSCPRRFRRRLNQSNLLRSKTTSRANAVSLEVGAYVRLRGIVTAGSRKLESPQKHVPCVAYRVVTVRVVDSRRAKKKVRWWTMVLVIDTRVLSVFLLRYMADQLS